MEVLGEVRLGVKIHGFSWKFPFVVAKRLVVPLLLGTDFFMKTGLVLDVPKCRCHFDFAPDNHVPFSGSQLSNFALQAVTQQVELARGVFELQHLPSAQRRRLLAVIDRYPDVLCDKLGLTHLLEYQIRLTDTKPVRLPPYRLAPPKMQYLRKHIQQLLDDGVIEPSTSPYASPMFLVPKPDQTFRAVVDYRALNKRIEIESVPLPDIHSAFHWFSKAKYFTTLDLNQAYHQIPLSKESKPLTAFCTDWNLYQYRRVPFGIATGAQVLTRLLDLVFHDVKFDFVYHYLDDLVIYSETFEQHLDHVALVLSRFREAGLTVKPSKVAFAVQEISFLGHRVSPLGVSIDPNRTRAIHDFPPPTDVRGIARFVGMVNFYQKFIPNFARIAAPLNALRKKGAVFSWGPEQQKAFAELKRAISQPPVLRMADFSRKFILQTDASGTALGAVLSQEIDGCRQPIAYASRTLTAQERRASSAYELECLAVLFGIDKFRQYLEHAEFLLETDNQALSWLLSHPRQLGKIGRWVVKISSLKFEVQHIRGTQNVVADTLSRMFEGRASQEVETPCNAVLSHFPLAFQDMAVLQRQDPELSEIIRKLENQETHPPYSLSKDVLHCRARSDRGRKVVVPSAAVPMLFSYYHTSPLGGHLGVYKTLNKIRENFIWKSMDSDIRERIRHCRVCALSKPAQNTRLGLLASEIADRPFQKIFIDYVGKLPRSKIGNEMLLVCVDAFSKFVWLVPVRSATTSATIKALRERIFASFSVPETIVSDNAKCFVSLEFKQFCFDLGIKHVTTTPYYPQPSHAERFNRNLRSALIAYHGDAHSTWDENLTWLQLAFNTAKHEATQATPFEIIFPFRVGTPLLHQWGIQELIPGKCSPQEIRRLWSRVKSSLFRSHQIAANRYNRGRDPQPFKVGDLVYCRNHPLSRAAHKVSAKLSLRWRGPFRIDRFLTPVTARLIDPVKSTYVTRAHLSQLKKAHV
jgi:hypothetical protein